MSGSRLAIALAGALGVSLSAWWGLTPIRAVRVEIPPYRTADTGTAATASTHATHVALDLDTFRAPLWVVPPAPPAASQPAAASPPPPPFKLQLLAIVCEPGESGDRYSAMFYDPDADRLVFARDGDTLATRTVESVAADTVRLRGKEGLRSLSLRSDLLSQSSTPNPGANTAAGAAP